MKAIVAVAENSIIGNKQGGLPWQCKPDLAYFKKATKNSLLVLGANTYVDMIKSWPKSKEFLPDRALAIIHCTKTEEELRSYARNADQWKLSFYKSYGLDSSELVHEINDIGFVYDDIFVAGGSFIYELFVDFCDTILLSYIVLPNGLEQSLDAVSLGSKMLNRIKHSNIEYINAAIDPVTKVGVKFNKLIPY